MIPEAVRLGIEGFEGHGRNADVRSAGFGLNEDMKQNDRQRALVSGAELQDRLESGVRIVEVDVDRDAYSHGHVPGADHWEWDRHLRNPVTSEVIGLGEFEELMSASGIGPETDVVLYGDNNNWFACWAYWVLRMYGHDRVRILDGGFKRWLAEGRPVSFEAAAVEPCVYQASGIDGEVIATTEEVFGACLQPDRYRIVDARTGPEFMGNFTGPGVGMDSTCARGGHIPSALNVPWIQNCREDGTFKDPEELRTLYEDLGITRDKSVITYCAIGERASLTWFVLKAILGYEHVMNYDRSMAYWSRLPSAPVSCDPAA